MVLCGFVWFCVVLCGFLWFCVVLCGFLWFCVVLCGFLWFCAVLCGFVWFCVVLCGFVWFCVVLCGFLWFCVVLCGFLWFCVVLCGRKRKSLMPYKTKVRHYTHPHLHTVFFLSTLPLPYLYPASTLSSPYLYPTPTLPLTLPFTLPPHCLPNTLLLLHYPPSSPQCSREHQRGLPEEEEAGATDHGDRLHPGVQGTTFIISLVAIKYLLIIKF